MEKEQNGDEAAEEAPKEEPVKKAEPVPKPAPIKKVEVV
mgnify:CR=1 FL=1|jgi:hypothetical protein